MVCPRPQQMRSPRCHPVQGTVGSAIDAGPCSLLHVVEVRRRGGGGKFFPRPSWTARLVASDERPVEEAYFPEIYSSNFFSPHLALPERGRRDAAETVVA